MTTACCVVDAPEGASSDDDELFSSLVIDLAKGHPAIDAERVSSFGFSAGAYAAAEIIAHEDHGTLDHTLPAVVG